MSDYPAPIVAAVAARAGMEAAQAAVEISDAVLSVIQPIRNAALRKLWTETGVLARAFFVSSDPQASLDTRAHCRAAYDAITGGFFSDFDTADDTQLARMTVYFDRLKAAGPDGQRVLTDSLVAATLALANVQMTGAELLGRRLDESDILNIRAEMP